MESPTQKRVRHVEHSFDKIRIAVAKRLEAGACSDQNLLVRYHQVTQVEQAIGEIKTIMDDTASVAAKNIAARDATIALLRTRIQMLKFHKDESDEERLMFTAATLEKDKIQSAVAVGREDEYRKDGKCDLEQMNSVVAPAVSSHHERGTHVQEDEENECVQVQCSRTQPQAGDTDHLYPRLDPKN